MEATVIGTGLSLWFIAKIFVLVALIIYFVFAIVVVKQIDLMSRTVQVGLSGLLKFLSYAHLIFAVIIFIVALVVL